MDKLIVSMEFVRDKCVRISICPQKFFLFNIVVEPSQTWLPIRSSSLITCECNLEILAACNTSLPRGLYRILIDRGLMFLRRGILSSNKSQKRRRRPYDSTSRESHKTNVRTRQLDNVQSVKNKMKQMHVNVIFNMYASRFQLEGNGTQKKLLA